LVIVTTIASSAGEFIATEIAWNGSASEGWIAAKLAGAGFAVEAAAVVAFAIEAGLLRPIPRLGGYAVNRRVNARVFGEEFAAWVVA